MKYSCEVIKDLLPLYKDQVCSEESKKIVEEHLEECESCRADYEKMGMDLACIKEETADQESQEEMLDFFKDLEKKLEKKVSFRHIILFWSILLLLFVGNMIWTDLPGSIKKTAVEKVYDVIPALDNRLSAEDVKVEEIYQLESGAVYARISLSDTFEYFDMYQVKNKNGELINNKYWSGGNYNALSFMKERFQTGSSEEQISTYTFVVPETMKVYEEHSTVTRQYVNDGMYFIGKGGEIIAIWEKGEVLEKAPESIEEKVREKNGLEGMLKDNILTFGE